MKRIDAHMHCWTLALEPYYIWMSPKLGVLYRDYKPADARPLMQAAGVEGCVLVSAAASLLWSSCISKTSIRAPRSPLA